MDQCALLSQYDRLSEQNHQLNLRLTALMHTIEKLKDEKGNITSELINYKSSVIEKIKESLDALEKERMYLLNKKTVEEDQEVEETCCKVIGEVDPTSIIDKHFNSPSENETKTIAHRKYDQLQHDYDRLVHKCRHLDEVVGNENLSDEELRVLREANELLLHRYRTLEEDLHLKVESIKDEKEKYSGLLYRYENECKDYDNECQKFDSLEKEHEKAHRNFDELVGENDTLYQQYEDLVCQHKHTCNKYTALMIENKHLVEKVSKCKCSCVGKGDCDMDNTNDTSLLLVSVQSEVTNLQMEIDRLLAVRTDFEEQFLLLSDEVNLLNESMKTAETTKTVLENKVQKLEQERDTYKERYDKACLDCDTLNKERAQSVLTAESLREENRRLCNVVRKQRFLASLSDHSVRRLQEEKDESCKDKDLLLSNLDVAVDKNKKLLQRINQSDENAAKTIRDLRFCTNKLQVEVETAKLENEFLTKLPKAKDKMQMCGKSDANNNFETIVDQRIRTTQAKIAELERENNEIRRKLVDCKKLMCEQRDALVVANDLALQKSLEGSNLKENLEKQLDVMCAENNNLKKTLSLLDKRKASDIRRTNKCLVVSSGAIAKETMTSIDSVDCDNLHKIVYLSSAKKTFDENRNRRLCVGELFFAPPKPPAPKHYGATSRQ